MTLMDQVILQAKPFDTYFPPDERDRRGYTNLRHLSSISWNTKFLKMARVEVTIKINGNIFKIINIEI